MSLGQNLTHFNSVIMYALLLLWGLSTMWGLVRHEGIVVANSGIFVVLFIILGIGGLENSTQAQIDSVIDGRLRIERQQSRLEEAGARSLATRAGLLAQSVLIEVLEIRLSEFSSSAAANEAVMKKIKAMRESIVKAKASVLDLEKDQNELERTVVTLEANLREQQAGYDAAGNKASSIANSISWFETWLVILGTLQMTFGTYLVRRIRKGV